MQSRFETENIHKLWWVIWLYGANGTYKSHFFTKGRSSGLQEVQNII